MKMSQTVFNLQSGYECMVEIAMFNVQRAISPNVSNQIYGSYALYVVYGTLHFLWSFVKISRMVSELWSEHEHVVEMAMFNVQMVTTPKVSKPKLRFMFRTLSHGAMRVGQFHENISNGTKLWSAGEQRDTQNVGGYNIIPRHLLWRGIEIIKMVSWRHQEKAESAN